MNFELLNLLQSQSSFSFYFSGAVQFMVATQKREDLQVKIEA